MPSKLAEIVRPVTKIEPDILCLPDELPSIKNDSVAVEPTAKATWPLASVSSKKTSAEPVKFFKDGLNERVVSPIAVSSSVSIVSSIEYDLTSASALEPTKMTPADPANVAIYLVPFFVVLGEGVDLSAGVIFQPIASKRGKSIS